MEMANIKILLKRSKELGKLPQSNNLDYGELTINYASGSESISLKNAANEIVTHGMKVKQTIGEDEISPISQKALSSAIKEGINSVTTLVNVPVDKRLVYATLTQDEILSFDTSRYASCFNAFDKGAQIKIIAFNGTTSAHKIVLPFTNSDYVCFVKNIEVPVNGYGIITVDYDGTSIYVNAKVKERVDGYVGGEAIVALSNSEGDIKYVKDKNLPAFKNNTENDQYVPIGIVVIPKSHTQVILPDGDPRKGCNIIMSLVTMSCTTTEGSVDDSNTNEMKWGFTDLVVNTPHTTVNCYSDTTQDSNTLTTNGYAYLPSDNYTKMPSNVCPSIKYYFDSTTTSKLIPSPYKVVDGEWLPNEDYYTTKISDKNALSDFDGLENTLRILAQVTVTDWKSSSSILNSASKGNYPAACCCARFRTTGTYRLCDEPNLTQRVWYLPACGELGYIVPNFKANNDALVAISSLYGNSLHLKAQGFWSSSESHVPFAWNLHTNDGNTYGNNKSNSAFTRAYCALPA